MSEELSVSRAGMGGRDLDEARAMYEDDYTGSGFVAELSDESFAYRYTVAGDENMTLRSSMFLGSIQGSIQPENEYVVSWILGGSGVMDIGRDETELTLGRPAMFPTGRPFAFEFKDYRQSLIHFRAGFLEQVAAEHEDALQAPIRFDHTAEPAPAALARWKTVVDETALHILQKAPTALQMAELTRRTAVTLLDTFPHETTVLPPELLLPRNHRLRQAVDLLHARAHEPLSTTAVAEHVGLSPRSLQQAFQRQLGVSPTEYLRGIRLDRVRAELANLAPEHSTVAEVASRWGFTNPGRFAGAYVARFGEYPRRTLSR
jgi:AraC-like DNA-binding protein